MGLGGEWGEFRKGTEEFKEELRPYKSISGKENGGADGDRTCVEGRSKSWRGQGISVGNRTAS